LFCKRSFVQGLQVYSFRTHDDVPTQAEKYCQLVCNALSILPEQQQIWWDTYCENEGVSKKKKADNNMFETLNVQYELWRDDEELNAVGLQSMMQYKNEDDEEEAENPLPDGNGDDDILEKYTEI